MSCYIYIRDCSSSEKLLKRMKNWSNYLKIAKHHNTSIKVLEKLAKDDDTDVRKSVAQNKSTPANILIKLAEDDDDLVQSHVAGNPNTPINILNKLAKSKIKYIRRSVARNNNIQQISSDILEGFINDELPVVASLANNSSLSSELLNRLAASKNPEIRKSVATNKSTSIATLRKLAVDPIEKVRLVVARNPNCPSDILDKYTPEQYSLLPIKVVKRSNTSSETLKQLALSNDVEIRLNVAKHPNTSISTLEKLSSDRNIEVLEAVLNHPKCNFKLKKRIFTNLGKLQQPCLCRLAVFLTDYADSEDLAAHYNSTSWLERYAVAQNKKTPLETLKELAQDCNRIVRATAKESLGKLINNGK